MTNDAKPADSRELVLTRLLDAPRDKLYRCWTEPELMEQWFAPKPWKVTDVKTDVRTGGGNSFTMRGPEGEAFPSEGVYLEIVPNEKIVFTDAYTRAWQPSAKPFFTGIITFADEDGKTRYTARALHWTDEDREAHEKMGFHEGWGQCADQLEELARTL
ncbi:MAG: SRPBCC family protein [Rhizobiaceae bacterium]|nr:SRPBCC family protein [Rhizobiaceae bacterium]MCV0404838.1 SRPBCC family protein [Rhizobiaceae bacterium]